jgi:hypothetical protein
MPSESDVLRDLLSGDEIEGQIGVAEIAADLEQSGHSEDQIAAIIGDMVIGARRPRNAASNALQRLALARSAGAVTVREKVRTKKATQFAPWAPQSVTAGSTAIVELKPQRLIRVHAISTPSWLNDAFVLTQLLVGQDPQFITSGQVPLTATSENADGRRHLLELDSSDIGVIVELDFLSIASATKTLRGTMIAISIF